MMSVPEQRTSHTRIIKDILIVSAVVLSVLLFYGLIFSPIKIHVNGLKITLNDQVVYTTLARNFAETGKFESNIIYPPLLGQNKSYLYMPGHFLVLSLCYKLFGVGDFQSILPNLISLLVSAICIFLIGRYLYHRKAGFLSAFLFLIFPQNIFYTFTAMSELTIVASSLLAFTVFLLIPERYRPYLGPFLLALPFLFRETTALLFIPMTLFIFDDYRKKLTLHSSLAFFVFIFTSFLILFFIYNYTFSIGRGSMLDANVFNIPAQDKYGNAYTLSYSLSQWIHGVMTNFASNASILIKNIILEPFSFQWGSLFILLLLSLVVLSLGILNLKNDLFPVGTGIMTLSTLFLDIGFYKIDGYRGLRMLMHIIPFIILGWIGLSYSKTSFKWTQFLQKHISKYVLIVTALCLLMTSTVTHLMSDNDSLDEQDIRFLEKLGHDDTKMLVAPPSISLVYVYRHYPVRYSFIPANDKTLKLISSKYKIGTLILPKDFLENRLSIQAIKESSLFLSKMLYYRGKYIYIFKD